MEQSLFGEFGLGLLRPVKAVYKFEVKTYKFVHLTIQAAYYIAMEPILDQVSILYENRHLVFTDERFGRVVRFYFGMGGILSESSKKVNSVKPEVVYVDS